MPKVDKLLPVLFLLNAGLLFGGEGKDAKERAELNEMARENRRFEQLLELEAQVFSIMDPMMREAATYNPKESFGYVGAAFVTEAFYSDGYMQEARRAGFGPFVSVAAVSPGSPADLAGIQAGDRLISVNGKRVPRWGLGARFASQRLKKVLVPGKENKLVVERGDDRLTLEVVPERAAYYTTIVNPAATKDLRLDGDIIWMSQRLVNELKGSEDLAYTCAYSLAQSVLRHPEKRRRNGLIGGVVDAAALSAGVFTIGTMSATGHHKLDAEFSAEADTVALYLLAATGRDYEKYPEFWERLLKKQSPWGQLGKADHGRLESMGNVIATISQKQESGRFLFPDEVVSGL